MGTRLWSRRVLTGYAVLMTVLVAAHYMVAPRSAAELALTTVIEVSAAAAVLVGTACHHPGRRAPWWLLAAAILAGSAGSFVARLQVAVGHAALPFPSFADP